MGDDDLGGSNGLFDSPGEGCGEGCGAGVLDPHPLSAMHLFTQFQNLNPLSPDGRLELEHCSIHVAFIFLQSSPPIQFCEEVALPDDPPPFGDNPVGSVYLSGLFLT